MLEAIGLRKSFGARAAVADVSLRVRAGELLGLLGPNGAGKSTTIGMLCGLITPDAGQVTIAGASIAADAAAYKRRLGLVPQDLALFDELGAAANIELFGALYGMRGDTLKRRALEVLAVVGLAERARDRPATFSGGMKRRLNIACALVHDPDVLLLDEPTAGVDPQSRNAIFDSLEALKRQGKALVYTTHYMEEAERLADRIVVVDHGRVVANGTQAELARRLPATETLELELAGAADPALLAALTALPGVRAVRSATQRANLEDVFLALTGRQLRD
jgi:ABC-2 type transport system ATP-binding protein